MGWKTLLGLLGNMRRKKKNSYQHVSDEEWEELVKQQEKELDELFFGKQEELSFPANGDLCNG